MVKLSVEAAEALDTKMISTASAWPEEMTGEYRPEYFNAPPSTVRWKEGLNWSSYWDGYVDRIRRVFEIVKNAGMTLVLEARANTVIGNLDAYLRLHDSIGDDDFGCELDVMHIAYMREDVATTIRRAGKTLKLLQVCDSDGVSMEHMALGEGCVDLSSMIQALRDIGYEGILQLEVYGNTVKGRVDEAHVKSRQLLLDLQK
jgi:sugar phosphate isomerase/epimerase